MRKLAMVLTLGAALLLLCGASAMAQTQVVIHGSAQAATFVATGCPAAGCIDITLGTMTGIATLEIGGVASPPDGTFSLVTGGDFTVSSINGGASFFFVATHSTTFSFSNGTDSFAGNVSLTSISDDTTSPKFVGLLTITSSSGPNASVLYPVNSTVKIDFTFNLSGPTLAALWNGSAASTSGVMSSGEVLPVPEPATIALLGSGLLAVGSFLRRRR